MSEADLPLELLDIGEVANPWRFDFGGSPFVLRLPVVAQHEGVTG